MPRRSPSLTKQRVAVQTSNTEIETEVDELTETDGEVTRRNLTRRLQRRMETPPPAPPPTAQRPSSNESASQLDEKKKRTKLLNFKIRAMWTMILSSSFFIIVAAGHFYCSLLVMFITGVVFSEISALRQNDQKEIRLPLFNFLKWYCFCVAMYATGTVWMFPLLSVIVGSRFLWVVDALRIHHALVTYIAALVGLVLFVFSLRKSSLRYQFAKFSILLLTCFLVVGQAIVQVANIQAGLLWFILSTSCVIANDIFAYIFGVTFGRTRLIKLSPNKTVEGFIGGAVVTVMWSMLAATALARFPVFYCPVEYISFKPYSMWRRTQCAVPTYISDTICELPMPPVLQRLLSMDTIPINAVQMHGCFIGCFAAFFAPFGGFFASGLKRSLRIKDFAHTIPGHGGFTDRFDCQVIMGMFTYLYIRTFVFRRPTRQDVNTLLRAFAILSVSDKEFFYESVKKHMELVVAASSAVEGVAALPSQ